MVRYIILTIVILFSVNCYADTLLFVSNSCPACTEIKHSAEELINEGYDIKIIVYEESKDQFNKYSVRSTPTIINVAGTTETKRHVGSLSKRSLARFCRGS